MEMIFGDNLSDVKFGLFDVGLIVVGVVVLLRLSVWLVIVLSGLELMFEVIIIFEI